MNEKVVDERLKRVIKLLGEKYKFDVSEGIKYIVELGEGEGEGVGERRPRCALPFCNIVEECWCKNIKYNHGLMTQCTSNIEVGEWCKSCAKEVERNGSPKYGRITERVDNIEWKASNGKSPTPYYKVLEKLQIEKEQVIEEADNLGWTLPENTFAKPEKSKRGRPRKNKRVVTAAPNIDLIATLVTEAQTQVKFQADSQTNSQAKYQAEKKTQTQKDAVATPKKNKRGRPRKSQMTEMQTEKAKKMKKENKKMATKMEKENKKKEMENNKMEEEKKKEKSLEQEDILRGGAEQTIMV